MNFTSDIKKEIIAKGIKKEVGTSAISAFLRTSGDVGLNAGIPVFYFVSETENVAEFFMAAFFERFGVELFVSHVSKDKMRGRHKLVIQCPEEHSQRVAKALAIVKKTGALQEGISSSLIRTDEEKIAYILGAFLGGGSCMLPSEGSKSSYHLEVVFSTKKLARDFCDLLADFEILAKLTERKEDFIVYIKSKELISDFLSIIGAENSLKKFSAFVEKRDKANNDNRARNCIAGNADKAAIAAVKQVVGIEKLQARGELGGLSNELRALAKARLAHSSMSLQELADYLGVSKSCLNHRMRKLMELVSELE